MRLDYNRGPGAARCPDRETIRAEVARRLGFDPFSERGERTLRCEIRAEGPGLRAQIEIQDAEGRTAGQRLLTSRRTDCNDLVPGLLLVLTVAATPPGSGGSSATGAAPSMAGTAAPAPVAPETGASAARTPAPGPVRPVAPAAANEVPGPRVESRPARPGPDAARTAATRTAEAAAPRAVTSDTPPARPGPIDANAVHDEDAAIDALVTATTDGRTDRGPTASGARPPPARHPADPLVWYVGAGVLGGIQTLPHPSWGGDVTVGAGTTRFSIALDGRFHAPTVLRQTAGSVTLWTAAAWVVPCARFRAFAACALLGAGVLRGTGAEVAAARTATSPWLAAGARAEVRLPLSRSTALTLRLDGYAVPLQTVVELGDPPADVWRTPRVGAALALGFVHHFRRGP